MRYATTTIIILAMTTVFAVSAAARFRQPFHTGPYYGGAGQRVIHGMHHRLLQAHREQKREERQSRIRKLYRQHSGRYTYDTNPYDSEHRNTKAGTYVY